jgi:hypothetical protein
MSEYIVKTIHDRSLVIEAEKYSFNNTENAYEFFAKDSEGLGLVKVATIPYSPEILGIVKEESEKADFYDYYDVNEKEEEEEECIGCRYGDLLGSKSFFEAVADVIDYHLGSGNEEAGEVSQPPETQNSSQPTQVDPTLTAVTDKVNDDPLPIEHWKDKYGREWWGFPTPYGFVHFSEKEYAEEAKQQIIEDPMGWSYLDLTEATKLEDNL